MSYPTPEFLRKILLSCLEVCKQSSQVFQRSRNFHKTRKWTQTSNRLLLESHCTVCLHSTDKIHEFFQFLLKKPICTAKGPEYGQRRISYQSCTDSLPTSSILSLPLWLIHAAVSPTTVLKIQYEILRSMVRIPSCTISPSMEFQR